MKIKGKQPIGLEKYLVSKLLDELDDPSDNEDYKSKVKDECFLCHRICNPKKDYLFYVAHGNMCHPACKKIGKVKAKKLKSIRSIDKMGSGRRGINKKVK